MSNYTMHRVEKQLFLHTPKPISERAGFVEIMKRIFVRVFPYAPNCPTRFTDSGMEAGHSLEREANLPAQETQYVNQSPGCASIR
jgi:hypothetical protein